MQEDEKSQSFLTTLKKLFTTFIEDLVNFKMATSGFIVFGNMMVWTSISMCLYLEGDCLTLEFLVAMFGLLFQSVGISNMAQNLLRAFLRFGGSTKLLKFRILKKI